MNEVLNLAHQKNLITKEELDHLHKFRKLRNEITHTGRDDIPQQDIILANTILRRLQH